MLFRNRIVQRLAISASDIHPFSYTERGRAVYALTFIERDDRESVRALVPHLPLDVHSYALLLMRSTRPSGRVFVWRIWKSFVSDWYQIKLPKSSRLLRPTASNTDRKQAATIMLRRRSSQTSALGRSRPFTSAWQVASLEKTLTVMTGRYRQTAKLRVLRISHSNRSKAVSPGGIGLSEMSGCAARKHYLRPAERVVPPSFT